MEYNVLLLLPFFVVVMVITTFVVKERYRDLHDRLFLALLGCGAITCYTILRALTQDTVDYVFVVLDNLENFVAISICPLLFLYMRTVAYDAQWHRWYYWLFAPSLLLGVAGIVLSIAVGWDRILEIRILDFYSSFTPNPDNQLEVLYKFINIYLFDVTLELMSVILVGWSIFYLFRYHKQAGDFFANLDDSSVSYMRGFLVSSVLLLITLFGVTYFILLIADKAEDGKWVALGLSLWTSVCAVLISYNAYKVVLVQPYLDTIQQAETNSKAEESLNSRGKSLEYKVRLWMEKTDKPYCKEGLTITDMAKEMNVSPRTLSLYINQKIGLNFNRWINELRLAEAKRMLLEKPDEKIGYIAISCGFPDSSTFIRAFNRIEGCSPHVYRQKQTSSN